MTEGREQPALEPFEASWRHAEDLASRGAPALLVIDDVQVVKGWEARIAGMWRRVRERGVPLHVVLAGAEAVRPSPAPEWLDPIRLRPWDASALVEAGLATPDAAADLQIAGRSHPLALTVSEAEWRDVVRDLIVAPTLERDLPAAGPVRRPDLLRGLFGACVHFATRLVSLRDLQAAFDGKPSLETLESYLRRIESAGLVARLPEVMPSWGTRGSSLRAAARFRILLTDNALFESLQSNPAAFDVRVRNACLAHLRQHHPGARCWTDGDLEVDAVIDEAGTRRLVSVQLGTAREGAIEALLACCALEPAFEPLLVGDEEARAAAAEAEIDWVDWREWVGGRPNMPTAH